MSSPAPPVFFPDVVRLNIHELKPNTWNPNEMTTREFQRLVRTIKKSGMLEPVQVVKDAAGGYRIIGGEHRWLACLELQCKAIPAIVLEGAMWEDLDEQKFETMRLNIIGGDMTPQKMIALYEDLAERHAEELLADMMGFADQHMLDEILAAARDTLKEGGFSRAAQLEFDKRAGEMGLDQATSEKIGEILGDVMEKDMTAVPAAIQKTSHTPTQFVVPLSNLLRTSTRLWKGRRKFWVSDLGVPRPPRGEAETNLLGYDPVLTEVVYTWFSPRGASVFDPLEDNDVRDRVALHLERTYAGRDSDTKDPPFDLLFTSLPVLESSDAYDPLIQDFARAHEQLADTRFAAILVPALWSRDSHKQELVGEVIKACAASGSALYNHITCITGVPCAQAKETFLTTRRLLPQSQHLLVFLKGGPENLEVALQNFEAPPEPESKNDQASSTKTTPPSPLPDPASSMPSPKSPRRPRDNS